MPTPPLAPGHPEWPNIEKAWRHYVDFGDGKMGAIKHAADQMGRPHQTVSRWIEAYRQHAEMDPAIAEGMQAVGTGLVPRLAWAKTKTRKDGSQTTDYSVLLKPDPLPDDTLQRIREAFENMEPAEPVAPPEQVLDDLMAVWPVMDLHMGMHAWGQETGFDDYDVKRAKGDLNRATEKLLAMMPFVAEAVLILGGDTLHADDTSHQTPRSGHALDVDGRHYRVVEQAIEAIGFLVHRILSRCGKLTVRVLRGNHDEHSHMILTFALAERFRNDPRLEVQRDPRDLFMRQWGKCAVFAHHGDKAKPEQMALQLADVCPFWSDTHHRICLTGHVHHMKAKDIGGLHWESLRPFCPPDAWAAGMGFTQRRAMQALVLDKTDGLCQRVFNPISPPPSRHLPATG